MFNLWDPVGMAGSTELTVFIGWDPREQSAANVLAQSIRLNNDPRQVTVIPLVRDQLIAEGLWARDPKDLNVGSTQFSLSRFYVPMIMRRAMAYNGDQDGRYALFMDCDMMVTRSFDDLLKRASGPVSVVKHEYTPAGSYKMDGQNQEVYPCKNWSSVMLFDMEDPRINRLTDHNTVNLMTPSELHQFSWVDHKDIGSLPNQWNYLIGEGWTVPKSEGSVITDGHRWRWQDPSIANYHYTYGVPAFKGYENCEFAAEWKDLFKLTYGRDFDPKIDSYDK